MYCPSCNGFGFGGSSLSGPYGGPNFMIFILMIILFSLFAYFINKAMKNNNFNLITNTSSSKAMNILNERFAKSEIDEEEYKSKKNKLEE